MGKLSATLTPKPTGCKFGAILEQNADDDDLATVQDPRVSNYAIAEFVSDEWEPIGSTAVRQHRAGKCACAKAN